METYFAAAAPGLEALVAAELRRMGQRPRPGRAGTGPRRVTEESGGVLFEGELEEMYRANLRLRTASRVLLRFGDFYARAFPELRRKAGNLPWERYLAPGQPVQMNVTAHKSRLYHSGAVAERIAGAIADRLGQVSAIVKADDEMDRPPQLVVVRLVNNQCTISIDTSGELLHRRGYRQETAKAPLRETLAAAMLLASGWDPSAPLLDPFCGSGTIAIEAALLALKLPPGRERAFAFMDWPGFNPRRWQAVIAASQAPPGLPAPVILASDRDAGAIAIAQANAERAGVAGVIEFSQRAVSAVEPPPRPGWVVTNPPYGIRVSRSKDLRNLYAQFGNVLRRSCPGWHVAVLGANLKLFGQIQLPLEMTLATVNGGVNVRLAQGQVPGSTADR